MGNAVRMIHLYEVVYIGGATDSNLPLPDPKADIAYALSKIDGWDDEYLIPIDGEWIMATREEALIRKISVRGQ